MQGLVEPFTPMGIAAFRNFARGFAALWGVHVPPERGTAAMKVAAGRIYVDVADALRHPWLRTLVTRVPEFVDRPAAELLHALAEREPSLAPAPGAVSVRYPVGLMLRIVGRALSAIMAPDRARKQALTAADAVVADMEREAAGLGSVAERVRFVQSRGLRLFPLLLGRLLPVAAPGIAAGFIANGRVKQWLGDVSGLQPVMRSLPHNPTTEMDLALWRLSRTLKADGAAPSPEHPGIRAFLSRYGHRAIREIDLGMPRWRDDPGHVLNVLETYLTHPPEDDPEAHFRQGAAEAERAAAALVDRVRQERGLFRAWMLRILISRGRALAGMREYPKFYAVRVLALMRGVLAGAGAQLAAEGRLDKADDVFFLDLNDLESGADLRALVAANRADYDRELGRRSVPRLITSTGETFYAAPVTVAGALSGTAASPGVYEGRVRVIGDPKGARLEPGEVLVAPGTDPAWTPLFLTAGALVMEIGGMMSHGSVVAREYGIPAVVGVPGATQRLRTGQWVRVDGESGLVVPLRDGKAVIPEVSR